MYITTEIYVQFFINSWLFPVHLWLWEPWRHQQSSTLTNETNQKHVSEVNNSMCRHSPVAPSGTFLSDDVITSPGTRGLSTYLGFLTGPSEQKEKQRVVCNQSDLDQWQIWRLSYVRVKSGELRLSMPAAAAISTALGM